MGYGRGRADRSPRVEVQLRPLSGGQVEQPVDRCRGASRVPSPTSTRCRPCRRPAPWPAHTREALRGWLAGLGVGTSDVEAVLIAVGEACANAIEHGYQFAPGATVTVRGRLRAGRLEVEVADSGGWREVGVDGGERAGAGAGAGAG
ncbi:ATP-binding protein [Micromonospora sp. U56]|uniref:ATP-binding protein n=1 Tax=Micromonospora sp. U56 TaxID=2824900 RepID=UPI0027DD9ACB|nr:ATP-binding protein [Micromonospora sp. U56]